MRREFRMLLAVALLALPLALVSNTARAGITTDLKTGRPAELMQWAQFQGVSLMAEGNSGGKGSNSDETSPGRKPGDPRGPVTLLAASEYEQLEQGLITYDEAISGCGGAQVAGGDAGWGALALVGLFLALRRRK